MKLTTHQNQSSQCKMAKQDEINMHCKKCFWIFNRLHHRRFNYWVWRLFTPSAQWL